MKEVGEFRVSCLKPEYIRQNQKDYIIAPSVYFMTVLDVSDP